MNGNSRDMDFLFSQAFGAAPTYEECQHQHYHVFEHQKDAVFKSLTKEDIEKLLHDDGNWPPYNAHDIIGLVNDAPVCRVTYLGIFFCWKAEVILKRGEQKAGSKDAGILFQDKPIITSKEARKLLGKELSDSLSDDDLMKVIKRMNTLSNALLSGDFVPQNKMAYNNHYEWRD